ncbi:MAG: diacylglycerol kinase family lipid kinase [Tannerella sp.]|nr:diacylglycerol kinase family lipid kinase [Tannerella sp.]
MAKEIKNICVIINPISGVGTKEKIPDIIASYCTDKEIALTVLHTEYGGHAKALAEQACNDGADCVIAVGGDGTVNEVAQSLLYSDAVLGIIPKGSGNGLARELGIPLDVRQAVDVIFSNNVMTIDACKANDRIFFCTCGVGFDAAISEEFAKEKRRGSLTYIKNVVEKYLDYKPEVYELQIGENTFKGKAFLIACANGSQYGNNAYIAPHADICDGQIDITILSPFKAFDIGGLAIQLFTKTIDKNSKIKTFRAKSAQIILQKAGVMHIDGEPVVAPEEINISVLCGAIKVFAPVSTPFAQDLQRHINDVFRFFEERFLYLTGSDSGAKDKSP